MSANVSARRSLWARHVAPTTRLGRVACWMALGFVAWFVLNQVLVGTGDNLAGLPVLPFILYGFVGLGLGLATGVVALVAVTRRHERGWMVFVTMLPLVLVLFFVAGELLFPH